MSTSAATVHYIKTLVRDYNQKIRPLCNVLNIAKLPFPINIPLKTDPDIINYHVTLRRFMHNRILTNQTDYIMLKAPPNFPSEAIFCPLLHKKNP